MPTLPNASGMSEMEAVKAIGAPKWTPEPWSVEDIGANCLRIRGRVSVSSDAPLGSIGHYEAIATVTQREPHPHYGGGIDYDTRDANGRLIKSAPRLYHALTHLIAAARKVSPSDPAAAEIIEMCARAEQEQAKARGEAP